jgi:hypothetical protein
MTGVVGCLLRGWSPYWPPCERFDSIMIEMLPQPAPRPASRLAGLLTRPRRAADPASWQPTPGSRSGALSTPTYESAGEKGGGGGCIHRCGG